MSLAHGYSKCGAKPLREEMRTKHGLEIINADKTPPPTNPYSNVGVGAREAGRRCGVESGFGDSDT
jgi:hypothetical protein